MKYNCQSRIKTEVVKAASTNKSSQGRRNIMIPEQPSTKFIPNQTEGFIPPENVQASFSLELVA